MATLPAGWSDADIGSPALAGSASDASGNWTITGGGSDIWNGADQFNFASTGFGSDGALVAEVASLQNSDPDTGWSKAGVMFRNDTTAGSINVAIVVSATQGVNFQWRSGDDDQSYSINVASVSAPIWLELVRSGNNFTGSYSYDGSNWIQVGTEQIFMNGSVLAGLAVAAHNNSALNTATFTNVSLAPQTFGVYRELWTNLNPNADDTLDALTNTANNPNWPDNPTASYSHVFTNLETELNTGMNYYGQRLRTFVVPPTNGWYTFWIASDDTSLLFLSTGEDPANEAPIASVVEYTDWRDFTEEPNQQSSPIYLQGGQRYYLEALMQQGTGGDNLTVQWELPDGTIELPLATGSASGTLLIPFTGVANPPGIYWQPANATSIENGEAAFSLLVTNQSNVSYQWLVNSTNLPGANASVLTLTNLSLSANGQIFSCVVSDPAGSVTSTPA
ncbi:MAG TPA: PA14 domain-containing protein, partial [Verrucomicrobiae bacterium]